MQDTGGTDPSTWAGYAAQLLGAGGLGFLLRELVKRLFDRADKGDDLEVGLRTSILGRLSAVEEAYRVQGVELEAMRVKNTALEVRLARAETREQWTRNRYHRLAGWLQTVPDMPSPPAWIFEDIPREDEEPTAPQPPRRRTKPAQSSPEYQS